MALIKQSLSSRFRSFSHPGALAREPFIADVRAALLDARNRKLPLLNGLQVLGQKAGEAIDEKAPLILGYSNVYPDAQNALAAWSGTATYLGRVQRTFGGDAFVMTHDRNAPSTTAAYQSTFTTPRNTPFSLRLFVHKAHESIPFGVVGVRFGRWQLQVADGKAEVMRLKDTWTPTIEADINTLRAADGYDAEIDELRALHYDLYQTLPSGGQFDDGHFYDWTLIPESRGALNILSTVGRSDELTRILVPELVAQRSRDLPIYEDTALSLFGNGPAFIFQAGYPQFGATGYFQFPMQFVATPGDGIDEFYEMTKRAVTDEPAGTGVAITQPDMGPYGEAGARKYGLRVEATTSNPRLTPFLYAVQVLQPALPRQGSDGEISYDTQDPAFDIRTGISPLEEINMDCEGENWSRRYTIVIADPKGTSLPLRRLYEACEGRQCRVDIGVAEVLDKGLVIGADRTDAIAMEYNYPLPAQIFSPGTKAVLKVADGWALLDEHLIPADIVLDGMRLGAAIRLLLRNAGWTLSEIFNISSNYGRVLPVAQLDESPCVMVRRDQTTGSALRELMDRWGMGDRLWHNFGGVWSIGTTTESPVLTLYRDAPMSSRLKILGPLDFNRDYGESYNQFVVVGGNDAYGQPIWRSWTDATGWKYGSNAQQNFIGRPRRYPTVFDDGLRTGDDVNYVLRSLKERYGRPGRFLSFECAFHQTLLPGMSIAIGRQAATPESIHLMQVRVHRISGASAALDKMTLVCQEKVQRYGVENIIVDGDD